MENVPLSIFHLCIRSLKVEWFRSVIATHLQSWWSVGMYEYLEIQINKERRKHANVGWFRVVVSGERRNRQLEALNPKP